MALSKRGSKLMKMAAGSPAGAKQAGFPQQKAAQLSDLDDAAKRFAHGGKVRGVGCAQRGYGKAMMGGKPGS